MAALFPRALAACALGLRQPCSGDGARRSARAVASRRTAAARHWAAVRTAEAARRAAHRAQRAHGRASAREPDASWRGDWDASAAEAPPYGDGEDEDEEGGLAGMRFEWAEWLNRDGFAQPLRAAQAVGLQSTRALQQFADVWVDALLVLLPTAVPRQTVSQLVYVAVGCVALYMLKVLLSTLIVVASATLGIVCLSRWLVYNGTVDDRRTDGSFAAPREQWAPDVDPSPRRSGRRGSGTQASRQRGTPGRDPRYEPGDVVDVWYED